MVTKEDTEMPYPSAETGDMKIPVFVDFMSQFVQNKNVQTMVALGPDYKLRLAAKLATLCPNFYALSFPENLTQRRVFQEEYQKQGIEINLKGGNALNLSGLFSGVKVDLILLNNFFVRPDFESRELFGRIIHTWGNESEVHLNEKLADLLKPFEEAELKLYPECLKVAKPGYIAIFENPDPRYPTEKVIQACTAVKDDQMTRFPVHFDQYLCDRDSKNLWSVLLINNP
jgi:hypothetical protein